MWATKTNFYLSAVAAAIWLYWGLMVWHDFHQ